MSMQNGGHTNSGPKVFGILAEVFQSAGDASKQKVVHETFFIPHWVTTAFIAAWAPPRSMCVLALRIRAGEPMALGITSRGCDVCTTKRVMLDRSARAVERSDPYKNFFKCCKNSQ